MELKNKAVGLFGTSGSICHSPGRDKPEDTILHEYRSEKLVSRIR